MPKRKREMRKDWEGEFKREMKKDWKSHCYYGCHRHCGTKVGVGFWFAGWLFTIGVLKLAFWKAVLAILIWAYYLGSYAASIWH